MNRSKHLSNVILFPLCDARGVLMEALCDTSGSATTRPDALVFAWRLALPDGMNVAHAAEALLLVALSASREEWTRTQIVIIGELTALSGRNSVIPALTDTQIPEKSLERRTFRSPARAAKQSKEWWELVGRGGSSKNREQRKTRKERASREP